MSPFAVIAIWLPLLMIPLFLILKKTKEAKRQNTQTQLPPGPPKLPVVGNLHQLGALPHQSLCKLSKEYGPVMLLKLGRVPVLVISSSEAAKEVLRDHDLDCCSRPQFSGSRKLSYNFSDVSFSPYGNYWREMRKLCIFELFSPKRVQSFRFIREEEITSLMNSISQASSSAIPVDISEKIYALTGSIVLRMAFGKRFQGSHFDTKRFEELIDEAEAVIGCFPAEECFPYVGWIIDKLTGYHAKLDRVFRELDSFFEQVIDDHLKSKTTKQEHDDIIDVMLKIERDQTKSGSEAKISKDNIKAVLMDIFLAGVDSSAITVTWAMAELARNPRLMKKAQDEVRKCIGNNGRVTEDNTDRLQYLKMIIKETLRLHPPAPLLLPRETMSHFKMHGYDIYPKTLIQVNAWAIGRDPKYWEKPEEFFPERFIDKNVDFKGQYFELLPFGGGRRICPGTHLGLTTIEVVLANLLYFFNWKLPNKMREEDLNMEEAAGQSLSLTKKTPLILLPVNYLQQPSEKA